MLPLKDERLNHLHPRFSAAALLGARAWFPWPKDGFEQDLCPRDGQHWKTVISSWNPLSSCSPAAVRPWGGWSLLSSWLGSCWGVRVAWKKVQNCWWWLLQTCHWYGLAPGPCVLQLAGWRVQEVHDALMGRSVPRARLRGTLEVSCVGTAAATRSSAAARCHPLALRHCRGKAQRQVALAGALGCWRGLASPRRWAGGGAWPDTGSAQQLRVQAWLHQHRCWSFCTTPISCCCPLLLSPHGPMSRAFSPLCPQAAGPGVMLRAQTSHPAAGSCWAETLPVTSPGGAGAPALSRSGYSGLLCLWALFSSSLFLCGISGGSRSENATAAGEQSLSP